MSSLGTEPASVRSLREEEASVLVRTRSVSTAVMQEGPCARWEVEEDTRIKPSEGKRKIWYFVLFNPNIDSINWLTIKCVQKSLVRTESDYDLRAQQESGKTGPSSLAGHSSRPMGHALNSQ